MPSLRRMPRVTEAARLEERRRRYAPKGPCEQCGSDEDLVWDHRDPDSKFRDVSRMLQSYSDAVIRRELAKCRVLCRTCNTKRGRIDNRVTAEDLALIRRMLAEGYADGEISDATHGRVGRGTIWRIRVGESWRE